MAEEFGFYDPVTLPDGTYDREYNAKNFSVPFNALIKTGVMKGEMNELNVTSDGLGMIAKIDTGIAFINGRYYKNTSFKTHQHDTETLGVSRIDRIVIRMNEETDYRSTLSYVKKGVPSANPVPPALVQTESIYEISLAQVKIVGGQTFIATNAITDERGKDVICPWAGSNILPNFDDATLEELVNTVKAMEGKVMHNVSQSINTDPNTTLLSNIVTAHANAPGGGQWFVLTNFFTTVSQGSVRTQLAVQVATASIATRFFTGSSWSAWTVTGATSQLLTTNKASIVGAVNELFTSVSNGKTQVANAITQKGVQTSPNAEFATMASNIGRIKTGKMTASGTAVQSGTHTFRGANPSMGQFISMKIDIYGIPFVPGLIYYTSTDLNNLFVGTWTSDFEQWSSNIAKVAEYNGGIFNPAGDGTLNVTQAPSFNGSTYSIVLPANNGSNAVWSYYIIEK